MYFISQNSFSFSCSKCNVMQCVTQQCFWMVVTLSWASLDWFWIKKQKKRWWRKCQSVAKVLTTWKLWKPTENLFCFIRAVLKRVIRERGGSLCIFFCYLSCLEEFKFVYLECISWSSWLCLAVIFLLCSLVIPLCSDSPWRQIVESPVVICQAIMLWHVFAFKPQIILWSKFLGRKQKSLSVLDVGCAIFTSQQGNYLHWQNHLVCHNDTQDIAAIWEHQHWPDHNETATLYLAMFGKNRALLPCVAWEWKLMSTKVQDFFFF